MNNQNLDNLRHSCAHLLAAAVLDLYPNALRTIGPSIENGFYFDFDDLKISDSDLPKIEARMHEIASSWKEFQGREVTPKEAKDLYPGNAYKHELIDEFSNDGQKLTVYKSGDYEDLCRGGHCEHPDQELKHFKLLSVAGAYWRGNEKNKMLTRIYGTCWPSKKELDDYLNMLEEAKRRDHKKVGRELELFLMHETSPGMPYWLPKGVVMYNELIKFWREEHETRGYQEIVSPMLNKKELYVISGHYDHYWQDMFVAKTEDEGEYGVKAMNCPNTHIVYASRPRSYKEFPLRFSDLDPLHRYELSGTLNGLFRVRQFRQDDAHIYVTEEQVNPIFQEVMEMVERFYSIFNLSYRYRFGTRNPDNFMGDIESWDKAEEAVEKILKESGREYFVQEGDGAFYGPKIDILIKDALGRDWQMGTIQLDFQQPRRFNLKYTDSDGTQKTPITVHRVIYGSLERFFGILIEHFAGAFPTWLSPVQAVVLPISDKQLDYAQKVVSELKATKIRVELNDKNEPLNARIRDSEMQKIPYILVVGDKEIEANSVSVRSRAKKQSVSKSVSEFVSEISQEISTRALTTSPSNS